jgi:hypothetical protein
VNSTMCILIARENEDPTTMVRGQADIVVKDHPGYPVGHEFEFGPTTTVSQGPYSPSPYGKAKVVRTKELVLYRGEFQQQGEAIIWCYCSAL